MPHLGEQVADGDDLVELPVEVEERPTEGDGGDDLGVHAREVILAAQLDLGVGVVFVHAGGPRGQT